MSDFLKPREVASLLRCNLKTLRRWDIPHIRLSARLVVYRREAVEAWLAAKEAGHE